MTPYELDATIARLRELNAKRTPGLWRVGPIIDREIELGETGMIYDEGGHTAEDAHFIATLANEAIPTIDALQAENVRLLQANMEGGYLVGELTAKLLDSEAALYKCWEMIAEKNRLIDNLQAKLLDAERRDSELQARSRIATNNVNDAKIALGTLMTAFPDHQVIAGAYTSTLRALKALDGAGLPAPYLTSTTAGAAPAPSSSGS